MAGSKLKTEGELNRLAAQINELLQRDQLMVATFDDEAHMRHLWCGQIMVRVVPVVFGEKRPRILIGTRICEANTIDAKHIPEGTDPRT